MNKEPFNVLDFDHGKYEFYERSNGSTGMIYRPKEKEPFNVHDSHHGKYKFSNGSKRNPIQFGIPTISDLDIEKSIDNVLSNEEYMKQINDFILEDEKERYVRALLNRLNKIIEYCDNWKIVDQVDYDIRPHMEYIVKLAKGDTNE